MLKDHAATSSGTTEANNMAREGVESILPNISAPQKCRGMIVCFLTWMKRKEKGRERALTAMDTISKLSEAIRI